MLFRSSPDGRRRRPGRRPWAVVCRGGGEVWLGAAACGGAGVVLQQAVRAAPGPIWVAAGLAMRWPVHAAVARQPEGASERRAARVAGMCAVENPLWACVGSVAGYLLPRDEEEEAGGARWVAA